MCVLLLPSRHVAVIAVMAEARPEEGGQKACGWSIIVVAGLAAAGREERGERGEEREGRERGEREERERRERRERERRERRERERRERQRLLSID